MSKKPFSSSLKSFQVRPFADGKSLFRQCEWGDLIVSGNPNHPPLDGAMSFGAFTDKDRIWSMTTRSGWETRAMATKIDQMSDNELLEFFQQDKAHCEPHSIPSTV